MNRRNTRTIVQCLALIVAMPFMRSASATSHASCEEALKECLVQTLEQRELCLSSSVTTALCSQSNLLELLNTRVSFSSVDTHDAEGPAFLGPKVIDKNCVAHFDTALTGALVKGPLSADAVTSFELSITSCAKRETPELTRP